MQLTNLIANNGRLYNTDGTPIEPLESGICLVGNRRFVFDKLYDFILKSKGEGKIPDPKIKLKRGRKPKPVTQIPKVRKAMTNNHRKVRIIARSLMDGKELVFESIKKSLLVTAWCHRW